MRDLHRGCLPFVANVATKQRWLLFGDEQSELTCVAARYLKSEATDSEIELVVYNYYHDGPMYEMMRQHGNREGEDYWASSRQGFVG